MGSVSVLSAQSGINYGASINGTLTAEVPNAFFTFNGNAGDLITAKVTNITPGLDPNLTMLLPVQTNPITNLNDPIFPGTTDARITFRLPAAGVYSLIVGSSNGVLGDFSLSLNASLPVASEFLVPGSYSVTIPQGAPVATYSFGVPGGVYIRTNTPGFKIVASLLDCKGDIAAVITGAANDVNFTFREPCSEPYQLSVSSASPEISGVVEIEIFNVAGTTPGGPVPSGVPAITETPLPVLYDVGPSDVCTVSPASTNVNFRAGPGTDYQTTGTFLFGGRANPVGQALGTDGYMWWQLPPAGDYKWVRSDVVVARGACTVVPTISPPPPPTLIATYTPDWTQTPVIITATPSETYTPTVTYTPSPTWTPTVTNTPGGPTPAGPIVPVTLIGPLVTVGPIGPVVPPIIVTLPSP